MNQFPGDGHYLAVATATMLTNHVLGLSPFSHTDFTPAAILYGEYIGFAAPQRIGGVFAEVPVWKEQGVNAVASGYRMLVAPKGWSAAQIAFWDNTLSRLSQTEAWKKELDANKWENSYMNSAESRKYLDARYDEYKKILVEIGLAK